MSHLKSRQQWIEAGFEIFAREGHEGMQVERLARILDRNKSGFYHYFGTLENYFQAVMRHLHKQADIMIAEIKTATDFDPGFLQVMVKNKVTVLACMQLIRNRNVPLFQENFREVTYKIDQALLPLWIEYIGLTHDLNLALRYFEIIRDVFFSRVTLETLNYDFLHELATEAKTIVMDLIKKNTIEDAD